VEMSGRIKKMGLLAFILVAFLVSGCGRTEVGVGTGPGQVAGLKAKSTLVTGLEGVDFAGDTASVKITGFTILLAAGTGKGPGFPMGGASGTAWSLVIEGKAKNLSPDKPMIVSLLLGVRETNNGNDIGEGLFHDYYFEPGQEQDLKAAVPCQMAMEVKGIVRPYLDVLLGAVPTAGGIKVVLSNGQLSGPEYSLPLGSVNTSRDFPTGGPSSWTYAVPGTKEHAAAFVDSYALKGGFKRVVLAPTSGTVSRKYLGRGGVIIGGDPSKYYEEAADMVFSDPIGAPGTECTVKITYSAPSQ
jgi:hypothetical protein